jgi:hypothetical protein
MNELFAQLFGQSPSYANALFGEDEAARLRQQAQQQGLLNVGLSLLAGAGPSPQRRGVGQLLAQGVAAGQQAYQGAYDKAMRDRMIQEQIQEQQRARAEQTMAQQILPQLYRPGAATPTFYGKPTERPLLDDQGTMLPGAGMTVGQPQIDMAALQQLLTRAPGVAAKVLPTIETLRKLNAPERIKLGAEETLTEIGPDGQMRVVATGAGKLEKPPSKIQEFLAYSNMTPQQQRSFLELQRAGAGGATVNVGDKSFSSAFGQGVAEAVQQGYQNAIAASSTLDSIAAIRPILQSGEVFSGPLANQQLLLARVGTTLGVAGQDTQEKAKNTAAAMQQLANLELKQAEAMRGQGAITENERALIARAAGGDLGKLTAGEVQVLLGALEKTAKARIQLHERNLTNLSRNPQLKELLPMYQLPSRSGW